MEFKGSKTEVNLKQAFASETYTYSEMYLGTVRTAREAGSTRSGQLIRSPHPRRKSHCHRFETALEELV